MLAPAGAISLLLPVGAAQAQFGGLAAPSFYPTGDLPQGMAVGDVDSDGDLDVVTADQNSRTLTVLLNNGDASYALGATISTGAIQPKFPALTDLDGDNDLDVAVANIFDDSLSVYLGDGAGNFVFDTTWNVGDGPNHVAAGDLDGDGDLDLAVTLQQVAQVAVMLNDGAGNFQIVNAFGTDGTPVWTAIGDLDDDGDNDLGVAARANVFISILLNNGDGTFADDVLYVISPGTFTPNWIEFGDLDGDSDLDAAVTAQSNDVVSVLLNNGDGTFGAGALFTVGDAPGPGDLGDLDNDGVLDIVVTNGFDSDVSVLLGLGDGTFTNQQRFPTGTAPIMAVIEDLDQDGARDVATVNTSVDNIAVLLNETEVTPPGSFDLQTPADGAVAVPLAPTFSWLPAPGASITYALTVATDATLMNVVFQQSGLTDTVFEFEPGVLMGATTYHWGVVASNAAGSTSSTPASASFTTLILGDLDMDGDVDGADLAILLGAWTSP